MISKHVLCILFYFSYYICKIRFYFKQNLANASVFDSIKFQSIKTYLFYGHHTLGPSVFIPDETSAVAVGYKGYTPSCCISRNSGKLVQKALRQRNTVLITAFFDLHISPSSCISKCLFSQNKNKSCRCSYLL